MPNRNALLLLLAAAACGGCSFFKDVGLAPEEPDPTAVARAVTPDAPSHVVVEHVLLAFDGTKVAGATRTKDEARVLANNVFEQAKGGRDFDELVRLYSDDRGGGGKIALANYGVPTDAGELERRKMVRGFSAAAFSLAVGEIALVEYDVNASPFGWHVVKRLK
jgi:peptidyl-prolyl cis-trans isomerase D